MFPILTLSGLCFSHFYLHSNGIRTIDHVHDIPVISWEDEECVDVIRMGSGRFTNVGFQCTN